jgi:hypothetical protein
MEEVAQDRRLAENRRGAQRADDDSMMITRAAFAVVLTLAFLAAPLAAEAQETGKIYRLGILSPAAVPDPLVATSPNSVPLALGELTLSSSDGLPRGRTTSCVGLRESWCSSESMSSSP